MRETDCITKNQEELHEKERISKLNEEASTVAQIKSQEKLEKYFSVKIRKAKFTHEVGRTAKAKARVHFS